jgi:alpha-tubulin suppressor-like RCC1 family protein
MINSQNLINKICSTIDGGSLTDLQTCQVNGALNILSNPVVSVPTFNDLPNPVEYNGRMIYVDDENRYYHAFTGVWLNNFQSSINYFGEFVFGVGSNGQGRLGDNTTVNKSSPVSVIGGFSDWCQVSAGINHSLGVRTNGTAWAWGNNGDGRLGDYNTGFSASPVSVSGGFTDWCQVSAGSDHSLGLRTNGTAWAWGCNGGGRLGDGTTVSKRSPVSVVGGFSDWCQVSAGRYHSLGVRTNGTAWAWGCNGGRLGDGTTVTRSSPVLVAGGFTDWCQVSINYGNHNLGVRCNGTIWAWGNNAQGQLGDGTTVTRSSPVLVAGGFTNWCQVSAGRYHSLGVRTNGTLWAWGDNGNGQLGNNTTTSRSSPVLVVGGFTDWCQVSGGFSHSLGLRNNGTAWAWGNNAQGQLGDGTTVSKSSPVSVIGGFTDWCQVSAGFGFGLFIKGVCKGF